MSIISIGIPIPDRSALPGQTGSGEEVNLQYATQNYCNGTGQFSPTVATPAGGTFTDNSPGSGDFQVNPSNGVFNLGVSNPGNYIITYTVAGVGSANFPINIGAVINTTITGDSATCIGFAPSPADLTAVSGYSNYEWFKDNVSVQNGTSNTYTPAFNVAGNFVYKVTITDSSLGIPCTATSSDFAFTVNALPIISISGTDFCAGQSTTLTATPSTGTFVWEVNTGSGFNVISGQSNNTISVSTAGDYRAKVTDANGCTSDYSTPNLTIAQFDSPTVLITTVPGATICTGDTATLTAEANGGLEPYTYLWSNSDTTQAISVAPTTTTTYTVTVTDSNGCTAQASQEITPSTNATAIASINNDAAMSFNGTDQYIQATSSIVTGNNSRSFSLWYKTSSTIAQIPLSIGDPTDTASNSQFAYCLNRVDDSEKAAIFGKANDTNAFDVPNTADGNWHHLVVTYDQSNLKVYIDGNLEATPGLPSSNYATSSGLTIGSWSDNNRYFDGSIDEVAIWDSALSSCDIKGIYEGSIGSNAGKAANLLDANTTIPAPVYWNRMGDS